MVSRDVAAGGASTASASTSTRAGQGGDGRVVCAGATAVDGRRNETEASGLSSDRGVGERLTRDEHDDEPTQGRGACLHDITLPSPKPCVRLRATSIQ
jgi:hypothetical protein